MISFVIANPAPDWLLPLGIAVPVILLVIVLGIYVKRR
jgi:hypothetical protein